jgi:hypothetical protein
MFYQFQQKYCNVIVILSYQIPKIVDKFLDTIPTERWFILLLVLPRNDSYGTLGSTGLVNYKRLAIFVFILRFYYNVNAYLLYTSLKLKANVKKYIHLENKLILITANELL